MSWERSTRRYMRARGRRVRIESSTELKEGIQPQRLRVERSFLSQFKSRPEFADWRVHSPHDDDQEPYGADDHSEGKTKITAVELRPPYDRLDCSTAKETLTFRFYTLKFGPPNMSQPQHQEENQPRQRSSPTPIPTTRDRSASQPPRPYVSTTNPSPPQQFVPSSSWMGSAFGNRSPSFPNRSPSFANRSPSFSFSRFPTTPEDEDYAEADEYGYDYDEYDNMSRSIVRATAVCVAELQRVVPLRPRLNIGTGYGGLTPKQQTYESDYGSTNMSPFARDIGKVVLDEHSSLWRNMGYGAGGDVGEGGGTSSRRHSVSVVQRGFNAPEQQPYEPGMGRGRGRGALMLSDDDLVGDFSGLALDEPRASPMTMNLLSSRSLPRYANPDPVYRPMNVHQRVPSDEYWPQNQPASPTARYVPGQGIQYFENEPQGRQRAPSVTSPHPHTQAQPQPRPRAPSVTSPVSPGPTTNARDLGKGIPIHAIPSSWPLVLVAFKAGRSDLFYLSPDADPDLQTLRQGDAVLVEGDRGRDLGTVLRAGVAVGEVEELQRRRSAAHEGDDKAGEVNPKMILTRATAKDLASISSKLADEAKALSLCQAKVKAKGLPMEVVDAEYQWDRRKLTFYYVNASVGEGGRKGRIDFRELVKELFRLYKTRIWMSAVGEGEGE
ncbi:PSP1-domain-containing protein [Hymenopellis radicata]|nr:PSP1-domain-containing protein [Hymenopellis radicata]